MVGLVAIALAGVLAVAFTARQLATEVQERSAESAARSYSTALTAVRDRYIKDIVQGPIPRALTPDERQHFTYGDFPVAYELMNDVADDLAGSRQGRFRIFSDFPWPHRRNGGPRTDTEREILRKVAAAEAVGGVVLKERRGDETWLLYGEPVVMKSFCVQCHNEHPMSPKGGWSEGDVRGVQLVEVAMPSVPVFPTTEAWSSVLTTAMVVGFALALCAYLQLRLRRTQESAGRGRLFQQIVQQAGDAVISLDEAGCITTFNAAAERLLGYRAVEVLGSSAALFIRPEDLPRHEAGIREVLESGKARDPVLGPIEVEAVTSKGESVPVGMVVSVVDGPDSTRLVGALRDLRPTKRLEAQVRAREKAEAVGQLSSGIAHDFNNMLTVMGGNAEMMAPLVDTQDGKDAIDDMLATVERARELTGHLLAVTGHQAVSPRSFDAMTELRRMVELLRRAVGASMQIELRGDPDTRPLFVDAGTFEASVVNLTLNARDAMRSGGRLTIDVRDACSDGPRDPGRRFVRIRFRDEGSGIPAENLPRVLDPFFTTKTAENARGLGLSSVNGFVRQSGGELSVESQSGEGTTVTLYLPAAESPVRTTEPPHTDEPGDLEGVRVCLVDDEERVRRALERVLDHAGVECTTVGDAEECLRMLSEGVEFEAIVTDVLMPGGMSGDELARRVRRQHPWVGVVVVSGSALPPHPNRGTAHLTKPVGVSDLSAALRKVLAESRSAL